MAKNLYDVLGVNKTASEADIRSAYRKLAKELHPDLNPDDPGAEEHFKEVASAFSILGDEKKRKRYDAGEIDDTGAEIPEQQFYRHHADRDAGANHYSGASGSGDFGDMGDVFEDLFGNRTRTRGGGSTSSMQFAGNDVRYHLEVDFIEVAKGAKKRITLPDGNSLDVTIPVGVESGQTLRLKGKGQPGLNGGPAGDALITITVLPHALFQRDGNDILLEVPIGIHEATQGGKAQIPTIGGRVNLTIPKGATTGQTVRLRGRGIQTKGQKGDQLVRFRLVMPETIDDDLAAFMDKWADDHGYDPRENWEKS